PTPATLFPYTTLFRSVGYQEQHPIGIPMYETRHRRMAFFAARVVQFPGSRMSFLDTRNHLPANRAILVRGIYEIEKVRRDRQREDRKSTRLNSSHVKI